MVSQFRNGLGKSLRARSSIRTRGLSSSEIHREKRAVRYVLALLICCLTARGVLAQTVGAGSADITGYGIVSGPDGVKDGVSSSGIEHRRSKGNHIVETTTRVPA